MTAGKQADDPAAHWRRVDIELGARSYAIHIGAGLLGRADHLLPWVGGKQVFLVSNDVVAPLYLQRVKDSLSTKQLFELILPDGEHTKSWDTAGQIFDRLLACRCDRNVTLVALGGGVIGDLTGFAAACYQRGVAFLQLPTTLLSQVDSSVGGKTGVNHAGGKNMIGAFHQPVHVLADTATLMSLPEREFAAGMAEVIKYGVINDLAFFVWLEQNMQAIMRRDRALLADLIEHCCRNKARIVEQDERETGVRAWLNLGHTFGHALEAGSGYADWLHGEAVATGIVMAARMSQRLGYLEAADCRRITQLLQQAQLPVRPFTGLTAAAMLQHMRIDKKVRDGQLRLVLLHRLGRAAIVSEYDPSHLQATLAEFCVDG